MCEPISSGTALAIGAAISVATTAASMYVANEATIAQAEHSNEVVRQQQEHQNQTILAQAEYQNKLVEEQNKAIARNYALADEAEALQTTAVQSRVAQEDAQSFEEESEVARDARAARATAITAAAESGVAGLSVSALLRDFHQQEARFRDISRRNVEYGHRQAEDELRGVSSTAAGRRQNLQPYLPVPTARTPIARQFTGGGPSLVGGALKVGGDIFGQYNKLFGTRPSVTPTVANTSLGSNYYSAGGGYYM